MKVFISWSGKTSGELAKVLRKWLPSVIQAVKPFYSEDDIEKGDRGNTSMAKELEDTGIGILCLTRDNLEAPWVIFEAGALSKQLDTSRVCPILFGNLRKTDLKGPLSQFQAARFNKEEMAKVVNTMNKQLGEAGLAPEVLGAVFEKWWPELQERVQSVVSKSPDTSSSEVRTERELLEEVLSLTRQIRSGIESPTAPTKEVIARYVPFSYLSALDEVLEDVRRGMSWKKVFVQLRGRGFNEKEAMEIMGEARKRLRKPEEEKPSQDTQEEQL